MLKRRFACCNEFMCVAAVKNTGRAGEVTSRKRNIVIWHWRAAEWIAASQLGSNLSIVWSDISFKLLRHHCWIVSAGPVTNIDREQIRSEKEISEEGSARKKWVKSLRIEVCIIIIIIIIIIHKTVLIVLSSMVQSHMWEFTVGPLSSSQSVSSKAKAYSTYIVSQAPYCSCSGTCFCIMDRAGVQPIGSRLSLHPQTLTCDQNTVPWSAI